MPPECEIPEDHIIQVKVHGKWLRVITVVVAIANGVGMPGLAWMFHSRAQLLSPVCVDHVMLSEAYAIRSIDESCVKAIKEVRYRLYRYLQRVEEFRNEIK